MRIYLPGTETLGWRACCGAGTPHSCDISAKFVSTTCGCGTSPLRVCAPPISLDGCGFFNPIVVRLPFDLISVGSEWWLFCILVVILLWLCERVSHVCLCHHLDQRSLKSIRIQCSVVNDLQFLCGSNCLSPSLDSKPQAGRKSFCLAQISKQASFTCHFYCPSIIKKFQEIQITCVS